MRKANDRIIKLSFSSIIKIKIPRNAGIMDQINVKIFI